MRLRVVVGAVLSVTLVAASGAPARPRHAAQTIFDHYVYVGSPPSGARS
jgi:hypothetical protein